MTVGDSVGNENVYSAVSLKNRVPATISFPFDGNEADSVYPEVSGMINIMGTAIDPDALNPQDFLFYELFYRTGAISQGSIGDSAAYDPASQGWLPIPVPIHNQSPSDPLFPQSNRSYRGVINGLLGTWSAGDLPVGDYTLLLTTKDGPSPDSVCHLSLDAVTVTIPTTPVDTTSPAIALVQPASNSYFLKDEASDSLDIIYNLLQNSANNCLVNLDIVRGIDNQVVYHHSAICGTSGPQNVRWGYTDMYGQLVIDGVYKIRASAFDLDGMGSDADSVDITIKVTIGRPLDIVQFYPSASMVNSNEPLQVFFELSKRANAYLEVRNSFGMLDTVIIPNSVYSGDTLFSATWQGSPVNGLFVFDLKATAIDDSSFNQASFPVSVSTSCDTTGIIAAITYPLSSDTCEGYSNFNWRANAAGIFYPTQTFNYKTICKTVDHRLQNDSTSQALQLTPDTSQSVYFRVPVGGAVDSCSMTLKPGAGLSAASEIVTTGAGGSAPSAVSDGTGRIWVSYGDTLLGDFYVKHYDGSTWATPELITQKNLCDKMPIIADNSGNIFAVWIDSIYNNGYIRLSQRLTY